MKKLQLFWDKSTPNKIITAIIILILLCCVLTICAASGIAAWSLFLNTSAPAAPVSVLPEEPALAPAITPQLPTPTTAVNQELEYTNALDISAEKLSGLWNEFTIFTSYASQYPEAINDPDWCDEFKAVLDEIDDAAEKLKHLPPAPEKFTELHKIVLEFSRYNQEVTRVMRQYLEMQDETLVNELIPLQEKLSELQSQLDAELKQLENK
mgnify:CR=1 FL=1